MLVQADEIYKICSVMGTPTQQTWPEGMKLAGQMKFGFPQFSATPLQKLIPNASPDAIDLMSAMCQWDPAKRPTAVQALQHPFFQVQLHCLEIHSKGAQESEQHKQSGMHANVTKPPHSS